MVQDFRNKQGFGAWKISCIHSTAYSNSLLQAGSKGNDLLYVVQTDVNVSQSFIQRVKYKRCGVLSMAYYVRWQEDNVLPKLQQIMYDSVPTCMVGQSQVSTQRKPPRIWVCSVMWNLAMRSHHSDGCDFLWGLLVGGPVSSRLLGIHMTVNAILNQFNFQYFIAVF